MPTGIAIRHWVLEPNLCAGNRTPTGVESLGIQTGGLGPISGWQAAADHTDRRTANRLSILSISCGMCAGGDSAARR